MYPNERELHSMHENQQHIPQYVVIKNYLRKMASEKNPNEKMPSETQIAASFGVSRGTAKQAITDLVYEGTLYRLQGKGTFVSERRISRSFSKLPSFTDDIRRMGTHPETRILKLTKETPTPFLQQLFELTEKDYVVRVKRLVSTEGKPIVLLSSYLNPRIYPELSVSDIDDSLYAALQKKYSVIPTKAHDTYAITEISPKTAELLQCRKNGLVCFSRRIGYLSNEVAVEYVESFIRYDRFKLDVTIGLSGEEAQLASPVGEHVGSLYDVGIRNVLL